MFPAASSRVAAVISKCSWRAVPTYVLFQTVAAVLGALATWATLGLAARGKAHLGAPAPAEGVSDGRAFLVEALISFPLVFVIIAVTSDRASGAAASISIGFALVSAMLIGGKPRSSKLGRALGPEIAAGSFWVCLLAPTWAGSLPRSSTTASSAAPPPPRSRGSSREICRRDV